MDRIYTGFESLDKHLKIYKGKSCKILLLIILTAIKLQQR